MSKALIVIFLILSVPAFGQGYYRTQSNATYFGLKYGIAKNSWWSNTIDYKLFDPYGTVLVDGKSKLKAQTVSDIVEVEIVFPVQEFYLSFAINFELFSLTSLDVQTQSQFETHGFPEVFKTDKFVVQLERNLWENDAGSLAYFVAASTGVYAFSMVNSTSLFGSTRWGKSWLAGLSTGIQTRVMENFFLNLALMGEYKYFGSPGSEKPQKINHNIFTYGLVGGVRIAFN